MPKLSQMTDKINANCFCFVETKLLVKCSTTKIISFVDPIKFEIESFHLCFRFENVTRFEMIGKSFFSVKYLNCE
jgi:hypothetical protein